MGESLTSLVLKRVLPRCTSVVLVEMLDQIAEGKYDFVHLPYDIRTHKNLSLAFVNFLDHQTAVTALDWLSTATNCPQGLAPSTQVHWGQINGLGPNLAHFIARFGIAAVDPPYSPFVFLNGICVSHPRDIIASVVTPAMFRAAKRLVQQQRAYAGENLGEAANFDEFWHRPQQLSDLNTLPWDNEVRRCLIHLESRYAIFRL